MVDARRRPEGPLASSGPLGRWLCRPTTSSASTATKAQGESASYIPTPKPPTSHLCLHAVTVTLILTVTRFERLAQAVGRARRGAARDGKKVCAHFLLAVTLCVGVMGGVHGSMVGRAPLPCGRYTFF